MKAAVCCKIKKIYDTGTVTQKQEVCGQNCPNSDGVGGGNCSGILVELSTSEANCPFDPEFLANPCKFFENLPDNFWKAFEGTKNTVWSIFECLCPAKKGGFGPTPCGPVPCALYEYGNDPCGGLNGPNGDPVGPGGTGIPGKPAPGDWEDTGSGPKCKGGNINGTGGGKGQQGGNIDYGKCCGDPSNGGILEDGNTGDANPNTNNGGFCRSNGDCGPFCQGDTVCMFMKDPCFEEFIKDWDKTDPNDPLTPRTPIVYLPGGGDQPKDNPPIWHVTGCPECAPNGWTPGSSWPDWEAFDPKDPTKPLPVTTEPGRMVISCNGEFGGGTTTTPPAPLTAPPKDITISYIKVFDSNGAYDCIPLIYDQSVSEYEQC